MACFPCNKAKKECIFNKGIFSCNQRIRVGKLCIPWVPQCTNPLSVTISSTSNPPVPNERLTDRMNRPHVGSLMELMGMLRCSAIGVARTSSWIQLKNHLTISHLLPIKLSLTVWAICGHHSHHDQNILVLIVRVCKRTIILHVYLILLINIHLNLFTMQKYFLCGSLQAIKKLTFVNSLSNHSHAIIMMIWCKYQHTCAYYCNVWVRHIEMWYYLTWKILKK